MSRPPTSHVSRPSRSGDPPIYPSQPPSSAATPMAISHTVSSVPPPLPPPVHIPELYNGHDLGFRYGNDANAPDFGRPAAVKPGSSLLGHGRWDMKTRHDDDVVPVSDRDDARRGSSISTITPGRDHDMMDMSVDSNDDDDRRSSRHSSSHGLQSERQLGQRTLEESSKSYDTHLLSRIGGPRPSLSGALPDSINHSTNSPSHASCIPSATRAAPTEFERRNSALRPLQVPDARGQALLNESPSSWRLPSANVVSAGLPAASWPEHGPPEARSSVYHPHYHHLTSSSDDTHKAGGNNTSTTAHNTAYDHHGMFSQDDFGGEDAHMAGGLQLGGGSPGSPRAGAKRRASSPPRDHEDRSSVSSASGNSDLPYGRRSGPHPPPAPLPTRSSPVSRFHPDHSSLSSVSSFGPRHGSLGSSLGLASIPSSATSYGSGRISPSPMSPTSEVDQRFVQSYAGAPRVNVTAAHHHQHHHAHHQQPHQHQRNESEGMVSSSLRPVATDTPSHARRPSFSHAAGSHVCECCPKKPKKFDTEDALRLHESEKQYTCQYCPNRFKNKNEAERHQNSLHLRRQSWSCAALAGPEAAFHPSLGASGADVCGYCGQEFPNPALWDVRAEHLSRVHKFRECNHAKKFYRADHFRQHLKHSHQGTSGKWTNTLENACMQEEPPPERQTSAMAMSLPGS